MSCPNESESVSSKTLSETENVFIPVKKSSRLLDPNFMPLINPSKEDLEIESCSSDEKCYSEE